MTEQLTLTHERVDDMPLLLAQLDRRQVAQLLDECFPTHGNWQGLGLGPVVSVWLAFILSEANHRMSHVEPWAERHQQTLSRCLGTEVRALDFSDDRLAATLDGRQVQWQERRLVVRSVAWAEAQRQALERRLAKAQAELAALTERRQGKKRYTDEAELRAAGEQILAKYQVQGMLQVQCHTHEHVCPRRRYGTRPARVHGDRTVPLLVQVDEAALAQAKRPLGWRGYGTNQPQSEL